MYVFYFSIIFSYTYFVYCIKQKITIFVYLNKQNGFFIWTVSAKTKAHLPWFCSIGDGWDQLGGTAYRHQGRKRYRKNHPFVAIYQTKSWWIYEPHFIHKLGRYLVQQPFPDCLGSWFWTPGWEIPFFGWSPQISRMGTGTEKYLR